MTLAATLTQTTPERATVVTRSQLERFREELAALTPDQWATPTDCTRWEVQDMARHVAGATDAGRTMLVFARHVVGGRLHHRSDAFLDGLNEAQIDDRRDWSPERVLEDLSRLIEPSVASRRALPGPIRRMPMRLGGLPAGATMAYLNDVIASRDPWMHRVDLARAIGRPMTPEPTDADVVEQVVRDLGREWSGPSFHLILTGPSGGRWIVGDASPVNCGEVEVDAVEFMRHLSGRPIETDLFPTLDEPLATALRRARVTF